MRSKRGSRPDTPCPPRVSGLGAVSPTAPTPNSTQKPSRHAAGVTTLLHEAWEPRDAERGHTSGDEAGTIAVEAGVSRLVLTHNHPFPACPSARQRPRRHGSPRLSAPPTAQFWSYS